MEKWFLVWVDGENVDQIETVYDLEYQDGCINYTHNGVRCCADTADLRMYVQDYSIAFRYCS